MTLGNWIAPPHPIWLISFIRCKPTSPRNVEGNTQFLACSYLYKCPSFLPPLYFFTFSYFFSQSCWCFLPEPFWCHWGTKRPTNGLQQKSAFNFFVGFFPDRTIIPGWCAGVRAQYGGWRTTDRFTETLFPFQILFWIDTRWFWVLKGKKEKNIRPTRSGSSSEVNGGEMRAEPKKLFLWKNSLQPKFCWSQTGKPGEYRETCYL